MTRIVNNVIRKGTCVTVLLFAIFFVVINIRYKQLEFQTINLQRLASNAKEGNFDASDFTSTIPFIKNAEGMKEKQFRQNNLPDVIGIGVRKCGTGVYMKFLEKHGYFRFPDFSNYETEYFSRRKQKGLQWYKSLFEPTPTNQTAIEKTPHYFYAKPSSIPKDILKHNSKTKVILLLCDPTPRAFSCFVHHYGQKMEMADRPMAFESYVKKWLPYVKRQLRTNDITRIESYLFQRWDKPEECILAGLYSLHVKRWQSSFNSSQMLIINGENMMKDPGPEYNKLQDFVGVPRLFREEDWVKNNVTGHFCLRLPTNRNSLFCQDNQIKKGRTRSATAAQPSESITKLLQKFYKPYNDELIEEIGAQFSWNACSHKSVCR